MSDRIVDIVTNKKARFDYEIEQTFEAGIVLKGTEVKSIRQKKVNIAEGYGHIINGEVFLIGMNVNPYEQGNRFNHEALRQRKLLLHKKEIKGLIGKLKEKGYTLVPLKLYFKNGKAKLLIGLGKGKANYDKRETLKKRDSDRDIKRALKDYNK